MQELLNKPVYGTYGTYKIARSFREHFSYKPLICRVDVVVSPKQMAFKWAVNIGNTTLEGHTCT